MGHSDGLFQGKILPTSATASCPLNTSPAAVVSTGFYFESGIIFTSPVALSETKAPAEPMVMITVPTPRW